MAEDLSQYGDAIDDENSHRPEVVGVPGPNDTDLWSRRHYARCAGCGVWVADPRPKPGEDPDKLYCRSKDCYPEPDKPDA